MNLQPLYPPLRDGQRLQCCNCFKMSHDVMADLDGAPFVDFYCADCRHACDRCGHTEAEHSHASGPCNFKASDGTHCVCYHFVGGAL